MLGKRSAFLAVSIIFICLLFVSGCMPLEPQRPAVPPEKTVNPQTITITYNYGDTGKVQLSANNITLNVGQKLVLQPAPGLTNKTTRFTSSGENFFGDIMRQESSPPESGKAEFTAIKPGKGRLQIIPNTTEVDRAVDLWVTVQ